MCHCWMRYTIKMRGSATHIISKLTRVKQMKPANCEPKSQVIVLAFCDSCMIRIWRNWGQKHCFSVDGQCVMKSWLLICYRNNEILRIRDEVIEIGYLKAKTKTTHTPLHILT